MRRRDLERYPRASVTSAISPEALASLAKYEYSRHFSEARVYAESLLLLIAWRRIAANLSPLL